jgi:uncharacterized protein
MMGKRITNLIFENPVSKGIRWFFSGILILLVKFYQYSISPLLPKSCRFTPTCSEYSIQAIKTHGFVKGLYLSVHRILRCHPWGGHGHDPVPPKGNPISRFNKLKIK